MASAKASEQAAKATLAEATAASQSAGALAGETAAINRNSQAKKENAGASRQAHMADLDLIFAAMYAQMAFAGILSQLSDITKKGVEARNALLGLESVVRSNGQSVDEAKGIFQEFKKDGLMSDNEISTSMKNLTLVGYSLNDSSKLIERFKDSAAFGRQASLGFGEAIVRTTEGIRLGMSTLSDGAGMAKNLGQILKENGYTEKDLSRITTDAGVRMALFNGIMKETGYSAGDTSLLLKDVGGSLATMKTAMNDLNVSVFNSLSGVINAVAQALTPLIRSVKEWIDENPRLTALVIILTTTLIGLVTILLMFEFLFPMFVKGLKEVGVILRFLTSPIGLVIAAICILGVVFAANKDMILDACSELAQGWGDYFKSIWDYTKAFCEDVGNMFSGLGNVILGAMSLDKGQIEDGLATIRAGWFNAGQEIQAVGRATSKVWEGTADVFSTKLNPVTLFGTAYDKVASIFDPVNVDMSGKQVNPRENADDDENGKEKKGRGGHKGKSEYQEAMREYEHRVHMEELKEYDEKIAALAEIGRTVEMTDEERMDYEEKVHDLIKEYTEDEKKYATELMEFQIKTGEKTLEDKIKLLDEQINAENDRHKKLALQSQKYDAIQQLKQYDKDYLDYEIDTGKKSLQDKLDRINKELVSEKNKFNQLRLLREKFETEKALANKQSEDEIKLITDQYNTRDKNGNLRNIDSTLNANKSIRDLQILADKYDKMGEAGKDAAKKCRDAIKGMQDVTSQWIDKFTDGLAQVITGGQKMSQFVNKMFSDIAQSFIKYQLNKLLGGFLTNVFGGMPWLFGKAHDGATIQKFHTGGLIGGLESDERVVVAQTGERILNRRETKAFDAATKLSGGGGKVVNYYNINAMDASSFRDFAYKNRETFGAAAAADAMDGGAMARAMKIMR